MVKVYVGNVPPDARANDLRAVFEKYGQVTECDIIKNYAFVHFATMHDANVAVEAIDDSTFMGCNLQVELSKNQQRRGPSGPGDFTGHNRNTVPNNAPPQPMMPSYPYPPPPLPYGMPMPAHPAAAAAAPGFVPRAYPHHPYPPMPGMPPMMPGMPPHNPMYSSEQFKDYFKRYGCMPPLPPLPPGYSYDKSYEKESKGYRGRSYSRSRSRSRTPRRHRSRTRSRSPYRERRKHYSPRRDGRDRYSGSPRR